VKSITADAIEFDINFSVELFDWIYRHLAAAGINWAPTAGRPSWLPEAPIPKNTKTAAERPPCGTLPSTACFSQACGQPAVTLFGNRKFADSPLEGGVTSELVSGIRVQALILAFYSRPYTRAHARARAATKIPPL